MLEDVDNKWTLSFQKQQTEHSVWNILISVTFSVYIKSFGRLGSSLPLSYQPLDFKHILQILWHAEKCVIWFADNSIIISFWPNIVPLLVLPWEGEPESVSQPVVGDFVGMEI